MKRSPARSHRAAPLRAIHLIFAASAVLLLAACASESSVAPPPPGDRPASELSQPPVPLYRTASAYPFMLRKKGVTGIARVEFIVTTYGDVVNAHAISATHPDFGIAAEAAISKWKFRPGLKDGRPVNCRMQQDLSFDLPPDAPKPAQH